MAVRQACLEAGMGVPSMARPRQTPTTATPARAPRKPAGRSSTQPASGRQKARNRREAAAKATTAKPNPFDDIARQVNADQEAKDRQAGRDDLTPAAATAVGQATVKPSGTRRAATKPATPARPAKPTRPPKVQATGNGVSFSGRPTTKVETVAARVKQAGLRIRADADVEAIAARLRATPAAVSAWLAVRHGAPTKPPAKATTRQPAKAKPTQRAMSRTLVQVIAQAAVFLEFADGSVLNLDAAVKQQEEMAFRLQQLSPADRRDFTRLLFEVADEWPSADGRRYLRALPGAIGLTGPGTAPAAEPDR
jgi:hypothetical protein